MINYYILFNYINININKINGELKTMKKNKQIKVLLMIILVAGSTMLLNSCYPDYGLTTSDFDVVTTFKNDATDFQSYSTFYIPTTIDKLTNDGFEPNNGPNDTQILKEIENQMLASGYTKELNKLAADVVLHVAKSSSTTYSYYPGYWGGYYGWYYPWYGGYSYSYTTGSLFVTIEDPAIVSEPNRNTGGVWVGAANGVLDNSSAADLLVRTLNSIDQMFEQSPYLKLN